MVNTSNAFEVRGDSTVELPAKFREESLAKGEGPYSVRFCAGVGGGAAGPLPEPRGRAGGHPGQDLQHPERGGRRAAAALLD